MENYKSPNVPRYRGAPRQSRSFRNNASQYDSTSRQSRDQGETTPSAEINPIASGCENLEMSAHSKREDATIYNDRSRESSYKKHYAPGRKYAHQQYNCGFYEQQQEADNFKSSNREKNSFGREKSSKVSQRAKFDDEASEQIDQHGSIVSGRYIRRKNISSGHNYNEQLYKSNINKHNADSINVVDQNCPTNNYQRFEPDPHVSQEYTNYKYDKSKNTPYYRNMEHKNSSRVDSVEVRSRDSFKSQNEHSPNYGRKNNGSFKDSLDGAKCDAIGNSVNNHFKNQKFNTPFGKSNFNSNVGAYKDDATQRERLMHHLHKGDCECLVCCDHIRIKDQIWHCLSCFHIFHLRCIRKWARSPAAIMEDGDWRCPACQNLSKVIPFDYHCFCGKHKNPEVNYHMTPHSCGEICGRSRGEDCPHRCNLLCHPGPCPPCTAMLRKSCACGKTVKSTPCNQTVESTCDLICEKILNCGLHRCSDGCHLGMCSPCQVNICQRCFCGKSERQVPCEKGTVDNENYSCGEICGKDLNCGHHKCDLLCHFGACNPCSLSPNFVKTCPCEKFTLQELAAAGQCSERKSCLDPIPVCDQKCGKNLVCGPKENPHLCESNCHTDVCPPCPLFTAIKCRCGSSTKEFLCSEITKSFVYLCEKRCNRRKDCGRHKCLNSCCVNIEHRCELICNKKLSCGTHHCQETCHIAKCPTCWNVSFDELSCHCGTSVLFPPIHCGTKPPECSEPCSRSHPCSHKIQHNCHSEESCPPCTFLMNKWCFGHHKQCGNVPCFLDGISCGRQCLMPLDCGNHTCLQTCHFGPCLKNDAKCLQPCATPRPACGHPCGMTCHSGPCPQTACKAQVNLTCPCGHRSETASCSDSTKSYHLMSVTALASKMQDIKEGQTVNIGEVFGKKTKNTRLQCNEECALLERNKRLAVALQIQNPELSCSPGPPTYSEFLKEETRKNVSFVSDIYDKISELVQLAKQSKQKCRSHSFPPMNRDHRRIIHELAEFFGCETQSYDEEPKKNVVVTAHKTKCWLPFASVMSIVQKELGIRLGIRKGPVPAPLQRDSKVTVDTNTVAASQKKKIDYFDYTP